MKKISIARDFSNIPAGRYYRDGPNSGQKFREKFLIPALIGGEVVVELDAEGYGSSFLEEAFGGLIRDGLKIEDLLRSLKFIADDPTLIEEIWLYINEEFQRAK